MNSSKVSSRGVEVVGERALEHVVHRAQVALVGHAVGVRAALPLDEAEDDALALPARRVGHELGLRGLHRAAHLPPGAHPLEAGVGQPAVLPLVVGEGAGVDLLLGQAARRADRPRLRLGPVEQHLAAAVGDALVDLAADDVDEEHPALGAVVHAAPGLDPALGVAHDEVLAHRRAALRHLDPDLVLAGAGQPRPPLVVAQQLGQSLDRRGVVTVGRLGTQPAGVPGPRAARRGSLSNRLSSGITSGHCSVRVRAVREPPRRRNALRHRSAASTASRAQR